MTIPTKQVEWKHGTLTLMRIQLQLMMLWDIPIHKYQEHTLEMAIIGLVNSKRCAGMTLVALSPVKN